jgi:hypothetical protein
MGDVSPPTGGTCSSPRLTDAIILAEKKKTKPSGGCSMHRR